MPLTRREFVLAGAAGGAALASGIVLPVGLSWERDDSGAPTTVTLEYPEISLSGYSRLGVGHPVMFDYPAVDQTNLLVRLGRPVPHGIGPEDDLVAFSNLCTHMGCPITEFRAEDGVLGPCPCHFTAFDLTRDGQPAFGQATQHLPRVVLRLDGDEVIATGIRRPLYGHADPLHGVGVELLGST